MSRSLDPEIQTLLRDAQRSIVDLRARLKQAEEREHGPIAIVGMSCRFPGGADSPEALWSLVAGGVDAIGEVPRDRWDNAVYHDPDPDRPGSICTRFGGFLPNKDGFDARFFRISPREAMFMDPQHRLMLELGWEALEHANLSPDELYRSNTGVFVGVSSLDYSGLVLQALSEREIDASFGTGAAHSAVSGRLSHFFGFLGPSLSIDTACSSSLVAIQVACDNLRRNGIDLALVGGVNLMLGPLNHIIFSRAHMLAPDGRCKTFDDRADGYVRSEGAGMVVLERLADALAAGHRVLGVIRGYAVNQDGPSGGLTVPNGPAQQRVVQQALADARLTPEAVGYVEAHGTGTALGDPIELHALGEVFARSHTKAEPLLVGSIKTNLGHTEPAAGIAGLIKLVLQLQHRQIAPHLHFETPSRWITWRDVPVEVPTALRPWPCRGGRRIGGVSSFGFTGTNAHVIVEQAPDLPLGSRVPRPQQLLALSARSPAALRALAERHLEQLSKRPEQDLQDLCHAAGAGRAQLEHRLALVCADRAGAALALERALGEERPAHTRPCREPPKVAFLFTGQGTELAGAARELFETEPLFREPLERYDALLRRVADVPLIDSLYSGRVAPGALHQTRCAQPLLVALQLALLRLLQAWGVAPAAVLGHSVGEISAACAARVLTDEEAIAFAAERGRLMQAIDTAGGMLAVLASEDEVREVLGDGGVVVAALNAPRQTVVSGGAGALAELAARLEARGIRARALPSSHAFHSPLMHPARGGLRRAAEQLPRRAPELDFVSSLTGQLAGDELANPDYWVQHALQPVRFSQGLSGLRELGCQVFVELGPQPALTLLGPQTLSDPALTWLASLDPRRGDCEQLLGGLAVLYERGARLAFRALCPRSPGGDATAPRYPFERRSYWFDPFPARPCGPRRAAAPHPLLGELAPGEPAPGWTFASELDAASAYLPDHRVFSRVIFPAAGYIELALAAVTRVAGERAWQLEDVSITAPLRLDAEPRRLSTTLRAQADGAYSFSISSRASDDDTHDEMHCRGQLRESSEAPSARIERDALEAELGEVLDVEVAYRDAALRRGVDYGPRFRGLRALRRAPGRVLGEIVLPALEGGPGLDPHVLHPVLLDCAFQLLGPLLPAEERAYLPLHVERLSCFHAPGHRLWAQLQLRPRAPSDADLLADVELFDADGRVCVRVRGLHVRATSSDALRRALTGDVGRLFHHFTWSDAAHAEPAGEAVTWLVVADIGGLAGPLCRELQRSGDRCVLVCAGARGDFERLGESEYALDPERPEQLARLWHELETRGDEVRRVLYLPCLDLAPLPEVDDVPLAATGLFGLSRLLRLVQSLQGRTAPGELVVVTRGALATTERADPPRPEQACVTGFLRAARDELPTLVLRHIDLDASARATLAREVAALCAELRGAERPDLVALHGGRRQLPELVSWRPRARPVPVQLVVEAYGSLDNLRLVPQERRACGPGEVEIEVRAAGLNFKDVLHTLGLLEQHAREHGLAWVDRRTLGFECAGVIASIGAGVEGLAVGMPVIGVGIACMASYVVLPADAVVPRPLRLAEAEAAGLPTAFATAYHGLVQLGRVRAGERVLVHAAAGGVGQAAIQICKRLGAEVLATASPGKWEHLRAQGVACVMSSRTLDFSAEVLEHTGGRGVDVVLNSLNGDFIPASFAALRAGGRFVEIGKRGIWSRERVREHRPDAEYFSFDLAELGRDAAQLVPSLLRTACDWIDDGALEAPSARVFPIERASEAFQHLARARNVGKVVLELPALAAEDVTADASPPARIRPDASYLLSGGLGALGLEVAEWLAERGARHLVLVARRPADDAARARLSRLTERGVHVRVLQADVAGSLAALRRELGGVLGEAAVPLAGVIHAAGTLDDQPLAEQTTERALQVLAPKVAGAFNLHRLTLAERLDFFVCFSSISGALGARGQAMYAAGNTFLDALMQRRRAEQRPGLSIAWGPWTRVGMAARMDAPARAQRRARGVGGLSPESALAALELALEGAPAHVLVAAMDWPRFARTLGRARLPDALRALVSETDATPLAAAELELGVGAEPGALRARLRQTPPSERLGLLTRFIHVLLTRTLRLGSGDALDPRQGFFDMGVDSLSAVELRTRLEQALGATLSSTTLLDFATPEALARHLHGLLAAAADGAGAAPPAAHEASHA